MEPTYRLSCPRRFAFGVGHVLNDMCASMWFSYLLVFFHHVLLFSNDMAGYLMLLGQIADAVSTPLIGYESDHTNGFFKYTKRKSWHLIGTLCVACSFVFLFMECPTKADIWAQFIYFAPFVVIFQFGWASTQISHLSLIPELTPNEHERVELNAIRYAFTVVSSLLVYLITWLLLNTQGSDNADIGPYDAPQFRILAITVVVAGSIFSLIFHMGVQEPQFIIHGQGGPSTTYNSIQAVPKPANMMIWKSWLKEVQFYQVAGLYMCTRLIVNLTQIYLPMFLTDSLKLDKEYIAIVPLVVYISGFLTSFTMRPLNKAIGRKATYFVGILFVIGACIWMWFAHTIDHRVIFGPAIFLGIGGSTILVTSLAMTADLIGRHTNSGAFVYGAMSFTDKLSNGLAVLLIQNMHPCKSETCCEACVWYYRDMMAFTPGGVAVVAVIILCTLLPTHIGSLAIDRDTDEPRPTPRRAIEDDEYREEHEPLLPEDSTDDSFDCCSYMCCLRTTKDVQARQVACKCIAKNCRHKESSYSTFSSPTTAIGNGSSSANNIEDEEEDQSEERPLINSNDDIVINTAHYDSDVEPSA